MGWSYIVIILSEVYNIFLFMYAFKILRTLCSMIHWLLCNVQEARLVNENRSRWWIQRETVVCEDHTYYIRYIIL